MSNRLRAHLVVTGLLALAWISPGCEKSPLVGPTLTVPVALTAISPVRGLTGDAVRVSGTGFRSGATLTLDGVAASVIRISTESITATVPVHAPGTVDLVVTNRDGQSGRLTGGYTYELVSLTASPTLITAGGKLTLKWAAPSGRACIGGGDWVALFKVGQPDNTGAANGHSDLWFEHLCGATSGMSALSAPTQPDQYEFRYMVDATAAARSNPVTVSAPVSPSTLGVRVHER